MMEELSFAVGDHVEKVSGDYRFDGIVVAAFHKLGGRARYVVENGDGLLHVFSAPNLKPAAAMPMPPVNKEDRR
jgi:hypothetical protein